MLAMRHRGQGCHSSTGEDASAGCKKRKAADCSTSAFFEGNGRLIAVLWATGLQLSLDRSGYLLQHANKTAVAYPTVNHWLSACSQLRPVSIHSPPARETAFAFLQFYKGVPFFPACLTQMCAFEERLSQHLATACGLSESSVV